MPKLHPQPPTPAARLIKLLGVRRIAAWTGRHPARVYAWSWPAARNGTGGLVPPRLRSAIIEGAARELGLTLGPADFEPRDGEAYAFEAA